MKRHILSVDDRKKRCKPNNCSISFALNHKLKSYIESVHDRKKTIQLYRMWCHIYTKQKVKMWLSKIIQMLHMWCWFYFEKQFWYYMTSVHEGNKPFRKLYFWCLIRNIGYSNFKLAYIKTFGWSYLKKRGKLYHKRSFRRSYEPWTLSEEYWPLRVVGLSNTVLSILTANFPVFINPNGKLSS